jgi:hypothetical protein
VDANGVYSFQFGATGTSDTLITETLATTDGTSLTYQKTLANTPVLAGTASVTDGTYSWNETTGNPGSPAAATASIISGFVVGATVTQGGSGYTSPPAVTITGNGTGAAATATVSSGGVSGITITNAGSGYTTGATISIATPPAPFIVNYSGGAITATYASAPAAGQTITATYRYSANGITGALAATAEQWLELTVDDVPQSPRQKVLAVPFAMSAGMSNQAVELTRKYDQAMHLITFSNINSNGVGMANPNRAEYQLPVKWEILNMGYTGFYGLQKTIDTSNISRINSIEAVVQNNSLTQSAYGQIYAGEGRSRIALVAYSSSGVRTVLAEETMTGSSGEIKLKGPFPIIHNDMDYSIEIQTGTYQPTNGSSTIPVGVYSGIDKVLMRYDTK